MQFPSFLLGILLGGLGAWLFLPRGGTRAEREIGRLRKELAETERSGQGIDEFMKKQKERKEAAKEKILTALEEKETLKNEKIAELVGVSSATVVRYMDELEAEGKVRQSGKTGRSVIYRLNTSTG